MIEICRESPMKLDKDPFPANMNMVELDGKKVLIRPSHAEWTMGKEVIIGEEMLSRMMEPKNERSKSQKHPNATFDILMVKYKEGRVDNRKREN
jgi:hypothetical protein